ncbi:sialate O-acetylesterase [Luteolibacter marinus]|uniref:sialate O-acetylesterase n=1 Tax=Luteolibacter marinus TaxID=2776705 RepID=UPI001868A9E3|nr:sialate O-acetylesterase [Luteolibacter marinus]
MHRFALAAILFLAPLPGAAELAFDSPFTPHMVLQRDAPIVVRGRGEADATLTVDFGSEKQSTRIAADGTWSVSFGPLPAGGPFAMTARAGADQAQLDDLLVGDVWVFAGQSNMQMGLDEVDGGPGAIGSAKPGLPVRLLSMPKSGAERPDASLGAEWKTCTPEALRKFSAVAWFFGKHLRQNPELAEVPLGLIDSSFGGTAIEGWTPLDELPAIPADRISGSMFGIPPGHLYNRMIFPLHAYRIKGAAWYQGEANAGKPEVYSELLQNLMQRWRQHWEQPELPFLVVQLPAFEGRMNGLDFSWLREAEADACRKDPNAWLAVTYDTTPGFDLHPHEKEEVGRRLALLARREVHHESCAAHGPRMEKLNVAGRRIVLTFDQPLSVPPGEPARGFMLAGSDGDYRIATATLDGTQLSLEAEGVDRPATVRFAWGAMPDANLTNREGLPAAPFRTDSLKPDSLAFQSLPTVYRLEAPGYALETGRDGSIASLVAGGKQFLSHEPGGGTRIPGGFGPRNLAYVSVTGPRRLSLSDGNATLEIQAREESMTWTLTNRDKDPIEFHVELDPQVALRIEGANARLTREATTLVVEGIDHINGSHTLVAKAPANGAVTLNWNLTNP